MKSREEEEREKKLEAAARASIIAKNKEEIAQSVVEREDLKDEEKKTVIKHLDNDKAIKKSAEEAVGLKKPSKRSSAADQFKQALTFFAPQLIGGALSSSMSGTGDAGFVAGYEEGGKARDSFIDYKKDMAELTMKDQEKVKGYAPKSIQQTDYVKSGSGEPVIFDPNSGKYKDAAGNIVNPSELKNSITARQEKALGRADTRIELSKDKFARQIMKEGQLSDAQTQNIADFDTSLSAVSRISELYDDAEVGPIIGRVQSLQQLADLSPEAFNKLKSEASAARLAYQKATSGLQVNEREMELIASIIPSETDAPNVFKHKLDTFKTIVTAHRDSFMAAIKSGQPLKQEVIQDIMKKVEGIQGSGPRSAADRLNSMDEEKRRRYEAFKARRK